MADDVAGGVVKVIEVVGSSPSSFSDAVRQAVKVASRSVRNIKGVDVISTTAEVDPEGELTVYKSHCKIAFLVESPGSGGFTEAVGAMAAPQPPSP